MTPAPAIASAIETRGLTRRYGARLAVDGLDLAVPPGTIFGFLGPNGAGKSTTLGMLCGLVRPSAGEARVLGLSPADDLDRLKPLMGYMPQYAGLYDHLTVAENLEFYADLFLPSAREARARVAEVLATTALAGYATFEPSKLSGGWRQRLALACAILHRPRILFLDEPTAGVDPISRRLFWDLLHALNDGGITIFVTTHYMEEVERCHGVGLMVAGRLRTCGSPRELKERAGASLDLVSVATLAPDRAFKALRELPGLIDAYFYGEAIHLAWAPGEDGPGRTRAALETAGVAATRIERRPSTMEDVFVRAAADAGNPTGR